MSELLMPSFNPHKITSPYYYGPALSQIHGNLLENCDIKSTFEKNDTEHKIIFKDIKPKNNSFRQEINSIDEKSTFFIEKYVKHYVS